MLTVEARLDQRLTHALYLLSSQTVLNCLAPQQFREID